MQSVVFIIVVEVILGLVSTQESLEELRKDGQGSRDAPVSPAPPPPPGKLTWSHLGDWTGS